MIILGKPSTLKAHKAYLCSVGKTANKGMIRDVYGYKRKISYSFELGYGATCITTISRHEKKVMRIDGKVISRFPSERKRHKRA